MTAFRLSVGGAIDRTRPFTFMFDNRSLQGYAGDTLASALLANGVSLVARSFKLHRPRGIVTAGFDEPNALVEVFDGDGWHPNVPATTIELQDGLQARSQNRWPSLAFDMLAINSLLAPFLPAGFYYKTFMWPRTFWEKLYEPAIRRAAGLGRVDPSTPSPHDEMVHHHCDLLVVGAGPAGLAAARTATAAGARVVLAERDSVLDASLLSAATRLTTTTVIAAYGHGVFAAVERLSSSPLRHRLHVIRARTAVIATGASERMIAFPGNDRPGVMLASAAQTYADRFAVAVGRRVALFVNNDAAYATAHVLAAQGVEISAIVDPRTDSAAIAGARARGLTVLTASEVCATRGRRALHAIDIRQKGETRATTIHSDALCVSGGFNPLLQLASQARLPLAWREDIAAFVPACDNAVVRVAGAARGVFGGHAAARDGSAQAVAALAGIGMSAKACSLPDSADDGMLALQPLWRVDAPGKAFVDLQHDVTVDDVRLAHREGYGHVEHMKRYTTHGMATDQGRIGGLLGTAVLAEARGVAIADVGLPTFRPYASPVPWSVLAGAEVGQHFKPERRLPLHDWHAANGAVFVRVGLWMRPLVYSLMGDTSWEPVLEEARAVRSSVGMSDASSLGKIDVQGPDAATFLDRIYANTLSTLPVGRARYGLMLREDGMVFDDGTTSRLSPTHFLITTTTQKADDVLAHMEWHLQAVWPDLDVTLSNVADHWAQFAIAGPNARRVLEQVVAGVGLTNEALPFMGVSEAVIADIPGHLFRISFSGELAYEVAIPARYALHVWQRLLDAGRAFGIRPYGLDALNVMRIEKGHVTGAEINGQTTAADLGLGKMLKKSGDFVGRHLGHRVGLVDPKRLQLVGLRTVSPGERIRGGAHLVAQGASESQGYVTSPCMAAASDGWIALALLAGGHARHGEHLIATSPVFDEAAAVVVVSPHMLDPENTRVRA